MNAKISDLSPARQCLSDASKRYLAQFVPR
jgi:hypothetical protein